MDLLLRSTLTVTLLLGIILGAAFIQPPWLADLGLDFWRIPELEKVMDTQRQIAHELENERKTIIATHEKKVKVLKKIIAQEITLSEGVEKIRQITGTEEMEKVCRYLSIEGADQKERFHRVVMFWLEKETSRNSETPQKVMAPLQAEFQRIIIEERKPIS